MAETEIPIEILMKMIEDDQQQFGVKYIIKTYRGINRTYKDIVDRIIRIHMKIYPLAVVLQMHSKMPIYRSMTTPRLTEIFSPVLDGIRESEGFNDASPKDMLEYLSKYAILLLFPEVNGSVPVLDEFSRIMNMRLSTFIADIPDPLPAMVAVYFAVVIMSTSPYLDIDGSEEAYHSAEFQLSEGTYSLSNFPATDGTVVLSLHRARRIMRHDLRSIPKTIEDMFDVIWGYVSNDSLLSITIIVGNRKTVYPFSI